MTRCSLANMQKTLTPHVQRGKTRVETLCLLVLGMISARTVNLPILLTSVRLALRLHRHVAACNAFSNGCCFPMTGAWEL